jgi:glycosyltransferase involved in cell wall biosynthesis
MIVRNEERVLSDCLRSAKPFFKEIIVVDTGSTDTTREIAKGFGAKLIEFPWTESFSEARNVSLSHASGKWICWLDADDTLPLASGQSILEGVINAPADVAGFVVPVRFTDGGPHGGVQVDHVKLFRNLPGVQFEGRIHEQILRTLNKAAGPQAKIVRLDAVVLHSGYDTSEEGQARKRERDARLLELDLAERPNHPFVLFNLGMTAHYTDDHNCAVEWLQKCLEHSEDAESHVKKAHVMLGVSLLNLGRKLEAIETWNKGLKLASDPELHFHLAKTAAEDKQLDVAREHYLAALSSDVSGQYNSIDRGVMGFKTMHNLAMVEADRGDYDAARHWYLKAMEQAPEFRPSAFALFDLARQRGDLNTAKSVLSFIESSEGKSESWHKMREALFS